jgi:hypothetical protein
MVTPRDLTVLDDTRRWLERAVIGLNLCPFAKSVHVKGQIHYAVTASTQPGELLEDLGRELQALSETDPQIRDTTLLVAPDAFADFLAFNSFLRKVDRLVETKGLAGVLQVASFHPRFQFAGTEEDDISNATNRAPYPTFHLIREASIDRAVQSFPQAEAIYEVNIATLERLGPAGWRALGVGATSPGRAEESIDTQFKPAK